ncbi:capsule assembly Wzi family protein [Spirosoma daeguense]
MSKRLLWIIFGWISGLTAAAQSSERINYSVELGGIGATDSQIPFWLRTNQYGIVPLRGSFGTGRLSAMKDYHPKTDSTTHRKSRFDWGFGLNAVVNVGQPTSRYSTNFLLPESFVKAQFGKVELFVGNRKETYGLGDTTLTSGNVAWSGNALPFPKVQLHTPDFVSLGFTKQLIAFRAGYAHGWLVNTYIQGSYLHQKYVYVRLGKPHWRARLTMGLNHQVQWGGHASYLIGTPVAVNGHLPTGFRDYLSMVIGHYPDALQTDQYTDFDGTNRIGNHIGSYDIALELKGNTQHWLFYHQHPYEDASGLALQNVPDGLSGIRYINQELRSRNGFRVQKIVVEFLSTMDQSGPKFDPTARYQGGDNYFNHSQYREGWSYRGNTLGTPFIMPNTDLMATAANLGGPLFANNRLMAWYTGLESIIHQKHRLQLRLSYSRNFGTFNEPYPKILYQISALASMQWALTKRGNTLFTTSVALDRGELLPSGFGGFISLRKVWR